uniref:BUB1 N-terminal domain-containing protein n=3 Tax=Sphaeramia orbicularis TaxID=375764 RepID=A0A673C8I6_9TELE
MVVSLQSCLLIGHRSACQSDPLSRGPGCQEEGGSKVVIEYCKELLTRGGYEFSFEELRAERYRQQQQQQLDEKLRQLTELKEQLSLELQEKKKLLQLRTSQQVVDNGPTPPSADCSRALPTTSFQIYESLSAATLPADPSHDSLQMPKELQDDVFLRPDERGLSLKIQCSRPGVSSESFQIKTPDAASEGEMEPSPPVISHKPVSAHQHNLSPIQEMSMNTSSVKSLEAVSAGNCSLLDDKKEQDQLDHAASPVPEGDTVDPCDPDLRGRLLTLADVTSCPELHSEPHCLPPVDEQGVLELGGSVYRIFCRVLDEESFSVYKGQKDDNYVLIKVDSHPLPWDFHMFRRLKKNAADGLPWISCFLYLDGCITVYTTPGHKFTDLMEPFSVEMVVGRKAAALVRLVLQMHTCRLVHASLQPHILTRCNSFQSSDWLLPMDWSSSVDLVLQQDITKVQQLSSAQTYISLGLLDPAAPPEQVDLVGVADTVHVLLTNSRMMPVKDADGWTAEKFSGEESWHEACYMFQQTWQRFFRLLLNAGERSSQSVLSELTELLSSFLH